MAGGAAQRTGAICGEEEPSERRERRRYVDSKANGVSEYKLRSRPIEISDAFAVRTRNFPRCLDRLWQTGGRELAN